LEPFGSFETMVIRDGDPLDEISLRTTGIETDESRTRKNGALTDVVALLISRY
jgi:hypothetical protein